MNAEIIAIGDEVASGQLLDTNTQWLAGRHEELGIRVLYHTAVGDELEPMAEVFRLAVRRADVVVSTGGLGPTADDLTREAIAEATGRELVLHQAVLAEIRQLYARRKREMPQQNERQAMFPEGSRAVPNPHGTAPGIALDVPRPRTGACHVFALPGVPAEMQQMWFETVFAQLRRSGAGRRIIRHRLIKCFGAGESNVEAMLPDLVRRGRVPRVGINASKTTIILRVTAEGATQEECDAAIEPTVGIIRGCLGNLVFGEGDDELEHAVLRLLRRQDKTLATAEWGTAGMVAGWLGEVPEAETHYVGGVVAAGAENVRRALGVAPEVVDRHASASGELAAAMAEACRQRFAADYALAVGKFPKFDPQATEPGRVFLALAGPDAVRRKPIAFAGHPATLKILCAKHALNLVRLELLAESETE